MFEGFDDPSPKKRGEALRRVADRATDAELPKLVRALAEKLGDDDAFVRFSALDVLGNLAAFRGVILDGGIASKIINLSTDEHERVRGEVCVTLALLPSEHLGPGARVILRRLLDDASPFVRREAAAALGDAREHGAADQLAAHLSDDDADAAFESAFALASLGDPRGLTRLTAALDEPKRRLDACEALRRLGPTASPALPKLRELAGKLFLFWSDRLTAWATIYAIGEREPAATKILERTKARRREERSYALALIGTHHITEGADVLTAVARDRTDRLRDTAVRGLGELGDASKADVLTDVANEADAPIELRVDAVTALGKLDRATKQRLLAPFTRHESSELREAAERALATAPEEDR
ncbi:HEAT repeat domain-containing protein [Myxococcota bacterium]|nr:HEAT repeat domain-containing protein [Myxococcota bacterium]